MNATAPTPTTVSQGTGNATAKPETIEIKRYWLEHLFNDWNSERDRVIAMCYAIGALLKQKGDDHCFNERQLLDILTEDILGSTETISLYKNEFFGGEV